MSSIEKDLNALAVRLDAGARPDTAVIAGEHVHIEYDDDCDRGEYAQVYLHWPERWFGVIDESTWGPPDGLRDYLE